VTYLKILHKNNADQEKWAMFARNLKKTYNSRYLYIFKENFFKVLITYYLHNRKNDPVAYMFQNPNNKTIKLTQPVLSDLPQDPAEK
jgi:hypothetical protein